MKQFVHKQTRSRWRKFSNELRRAAKSPDDTEAIHDLRVSIRRFTQCLRSFGDFYKKSDVKRVRKPLHRIMDHCGAVRNCDVTLELLRSGGLEQDRSAAAVRRRRGEAEAKLVHILKRERKRKLSWRHKPSSPKSAGTESQWRAKEPPAENAARVLPAMFEEWIAAGAEAARPGVPYGQIHRFRILTKHFRYTLELFETFYGEDVQTGIEALKRLQDVLGELNDCVTALDLVKRHARAKAMLSRLLRRRETGFREHWRTQFSAARVHWWKAWLAAPQIN